MGAEHPLILAPMSLRGEGTWELWGRESSELTKTVLITPLCLPKGKRGQGVDAAASGIVQGNLRPVRLDVVSSGGQRSAVLRRAGHGV
jgi:hypothetical protein